MSLRRINVKLGGINSHPVSQIYAGLNKEPTMIVGRCPGYDLRDTTWIHFFRRGRHPPWPWRQR